MVNNQQWPREQKEMQRGRESDRQRKSLFHKMKEKERLIKEWRISETKEGIKELEEA